MKLVVPCLVFLGSCTIAIQAPARAVPENTNPPTYRIHTVMRPVAVMHYRHHGEPTMVDFVGTALMPKAHGEAKVYLGDHGYVIEAEVKDMSPAREFGSRFMTYVLWGVAPGGEAHNLGELVVEKGKAKLQVETDLNEFAMMVTAEPDFAVGKPSDIVVLHNVSHLYATTGRWLPNTIQAPLDPHRPLELYEARNAVSIAHQEGAGQYAPELFLRASTLLEQAESQFKHSKDKQHAATIETAREAIQTAEAARTKTRAYLEGERARNTGVAQLQRQARAKIRQEKAAGNARAQAGNEPGAAGSAVAVPEQETGMAGERPASAAGAGQESKAEFRGEVLRQLQTALDTRDTPRGLVVTLSGALFNADQATLSPGAREKLAKISGILLAHPGLTVEVDGYSQKQSGAGSRLKLATQRAAAVADYLIHQGVPSGSISARMVGAAGAGADGNSPSGEGDRRVEMVVSGTPIGP